MRKIGQDRAIWGSSPTYPNIPRELERLRDVDSQLDVKSSGVLVFDVVGNVPDSEVIPPVKRLYTVS
jgi:hypothetical protein